ncbi:MAG TPA: Hsp20/alpha crystallin family protein [Gemmataceae bacterium]|nr:Hsp20/alpha crystallin family protein [Gemmataceae bacterium]
MLPVLRNGSRLPTLSDEPVNRLSSWFDRFFNDDLFAPLPVPRAWTALPLSMWEDEQNVYVEVDVPGLTDQDIDVSVHDGDLIIRCERKGERKARGYDTRTYGRFEQRVTLPAAVDADKGEAKLAHGVLSVVFPKTEEARPRKIAIKSE